MKKIIALFIVLTICLSGFIACADKSNEKGKHLEDKIKESVRLTASSKFAASAAVSGDGRTFLLCTCTSVRETKGNNYNVSGYVTFKDRYDERYKWYFDAVVSISDGEADTNDFEFGSKVKE